MSVPSAEAAEFATRLRINRIGIFWMLLASIGFIANDAITKTVLARVPIAQMIVVRGVMAVALIGFIAWRRGALVRSAELVRGWVGLRSACEAIATFLYLAALYWLPLANATAIAMSSPLFVAVLARVFLGERVDTRRWIAIAVGFAGVLMVIQPRAGGFNVHAWLCLLATLIYAGRDLLTRKIPPGIPSIAVTFATASAVGGLALLVMLAQGWEPMVWRDVALLALAAVCLSTGYYAAIAAMRHAEVSVVVPFRYSGLLWALVLGFVFWGDVPNPLAWAGIVLLLGAGLYMIQQQRVRRGRSRGGAAA